jgi:hypothetical protein
MIHESGALPVYHEYMVVTANVYDTLCSTDLFQSDLTQIGGVAQSATDLKDFADAGYDPATNKVQGVVLTDTATTLTNDVAITAVGIDEIWDEAMEGALTAREQMNINHAVLAGKSSGGGTATIKFRDAGDAKDRQNATVDANGNRTAVTTDGA